MIPPHKGKAFFDHPYLLLPSGICGASCGSGRASTRCVKMQGACRVAVKINPAPKGTAVWGQCRQTKRQHTSVVAPASAAAILLNTFFSACVSLRPSESMGLNFPTTIRDAKRAAVNPPYCPVCRTARMPSRNTVSKAVDTARQGTGDWKWKPPENLRMSMKGRISSRPSEII